MHDPNKKASADVAAEAKSLDGGGLNHQNNSSAFCGGAQAPEIKPKIFCGDLHNLPPALASLIGRPHWVLWPTTGAIDRWASNLVAKVGSYTEITVSGTGLRIIGHGVGPKLHRKLPVNNRVTLEAYRRAERYIVITGNPLPNSNGIINIDVHIDATAKADAMTATAHVQCGLSSMKCCAWATYARQLNQRCSTTTTGSRWP